MKILLISPIYPRKSNPAMGIYIQRVHEMYEDLGHEVHLITYEGGLSKLEKFKQMRAFVVSIKKHISDSSFDVINVHYPFIAAIPFRFFKCKTPLITSVHGSDIFYNTRLKHMLGGFTNHLLKISDLITVDSTFFKNTLIKAHDLPAEKILICPSGGFNSKYFYPIENRNSNNSESKIKDIARKGIIRKEELSNDMEGNGKAVEEKMLNNIRITGGETNLEITNVRNEKQDRVRRIGFASLIVEGKGWKVLLNALSELQSRNDFPLELEMAGNGPDMNALKREVATLQNEWPNVKVNIHGNLPEPELGDLYRSVDVFVFPTLFQESLGLVGVESLGSGTPVIASNIGGISDYLEDGVNGFLVPPGDAKALASAIERFFELSEEELVTFREAALCKSKNYEKCAVANRLNEILRQAKNEF